MNYRFNSFDERMRMIERAAAAGDPQAQAALHIERIRSTGVVPESHRIGIGAAHPAGYDYDTGLVLCREHLGRPAGRPVALPSNTRCDMCRRPLYLEPVSRAERDAVALRLMADELRFRHGARLSYRDSLEGEENEAGPGPTVQVVAGEAFAGDEAFLALEYNGWLYPPEEGGSGWQFGFNVQEDEDEDEDEAVILEGSIPQIATESVQRLSNILWERMPGYISDGVRVRMQRALRGRGIDIEASLDDTVEVAVLDGSGRNAEFSLYAHGGIDPGPFRPEDDPGPLWRGEWFARVNYSPDDPPPLPPPEKKGRWTLLRPAPWEREPTMEQTFAGPLEVVAEQVADFFLRASAAMSQQ